MTKDKLIIVDLDGTLFDTADVNYLAYKKALEEYGFSLSKDYYATNCNGAHYKKYLPKIICEENWNLIEKIHTRKKEVYPEFLYAANKNEHLFAILMSLRTHYHISLVTTASRKNAEDIINYFNVSDLFDYIVTHEDVKNVKPNPEGFLRAMDYFKVDADKTMIFEDSADGILAAIRSHGKVFQVIT